MWMHFRTGVTNMVPEGTKGTMLTTLTTWVACGPVLIIASTWPVFGHRLMSLILLMITCLKINWEKVWFQKRASNYNNIIKDKLRRSVISEACIKLLALRIDTQEVALSFKKVGDTCFRISLRLLTYLIQKCREHLWWMLWYFSSTKSLSYYSKSFRDDVQ